MDRSEEWEESGVWWLPEYPDERWSGVLHYSRLEGAQLELIREFEPGPELFFEPKALPVVRGVTVGGKEMTLLKGIEANSSFAFPGGLRKSIVRPQLVLAGVGLDRQEDATFNSLSGSFTNLESWLCTSGFSIDFGLHPTPTKVEFQFPKLMAYSLSDGLRFEIDFLFEGPAFTVPQKEVIMRQSAWLTVIPNQPAEYDTLREHLCRFADLIALGVGKPLHSLKFKAETEKARTTSGKFRSIEVFERRKQDTDSDEGIHPAEMLFAFPSVRDRFDQMVERWFNRRDALGPAYNLYFAAVRAKQMYVEHRFLNLFQALESYHRHTKAITAEVLSAHRIRIDRLLASVGGGDRAWLRRKLEWSHEPSVNNRLKCLVRSFSARRLFEPNWKYVIHQFVKARNYLTHYSEQAKQAFADSRNLYNLSIRLQMLCEVAFLHELGFRNEEIQALFVQSQRLGHHLLRAI